MQCHRLYCPSTGELSATAGLTVSRHMGQRATTASHSTMHSWWYSWEQQCKPGSEQVASCRLTNENACHFLQMRRQMSTQRTETRNIDEHVDAHTHIFIHIHIHPNGPETGLAFSHVFMFSLCFYAMKTWELP